MKPNRMISGWLTLLALSILNLPLSTAFATTNRVGVITVNYSTTASGSGGFSGGDAVIGTVGSDSLDVAISGQVQYAVLATETNLIIGSLISSSGQETASGSYVDDFWDYSHPEDPTVDDQSGDWIPDPNFKPTNVCLITSSNGLSQANGTGQFLGTCENAPFGDMWEGSYAPWDTGWMTDYWAVELPLISFIGTYCAQHCECEVRGFQFVITNAMTPWSQTLTTNASEDYSWTATDGSFSSTGSASAPSTSITLVYLPDHLTLAFTADPTNGLVPLTVHFTADAADSGTNTITNWTWNFGDGTNGTGRIISHTYTNTGTSSNSGTFYVTLTATNVNGAAVLGIGASNITVSLPTVQFTVTPTNGSVPLSVYFTFPAVDSADNSIVSWKWDFGDGTSFVDRSPDQPVSLNHIYTNIKTFSPKLTVTNVWGTMISSNGPKVVVSPPPIFFTARPTNGLAPLPVQFNGPGMDSQTNTITNWNWSFGDGSTSTAQNPSHLYASPGVFSPALLVTNKKGAGIIAYGPDISAGHSAIYVSGGGGGGYDPSSGGFTNSDGTHPQAGLVLGGTRLYGAMSAGGNRGSGTIFAVNTDGSGFSNLYEFSAVVQMYYTNSDGADPRSRLVLSGDILYGTAAQGGAGFGAGTVFKLNTDGSDFTALHRFTNGADGCHPNGVVLSGGTIYGTTQSGGAGGTGTIFTLNSDGSGFTQIHNFAASSWNSASGNMTNTDGAYPAAAMILAGDTLYGTTSQGGATGGGAVFKLNTNGSDFTVLHNFTNFFDGASPSGELLLSGGALYGTTFSGGNAGGGTVFKVNTDGSGFSTLHQFVVASYDPASGNSINSDGAAPAAGLTLSGATLYGTASEGGSGGGGTIFSISTNGAAFANLCSFTMLVSGTNLDGANPQAALVLSDGTLYGTAYNGGSNGDGALFTLNLLPAAPPVLFTATPTNGIAPVTVAFAGPGVDTQGSPLTNWNWSFGDGSSSAQQNPVHSYLTGGLFAPSLVANNQKGDMIVGFGPEIAVTLPTLEFTANPATGGTPLTVQFICPDLDSSGSVIVSWNWDFGDGSAGTGPNPLHTYTNPGDFSPNLVATNRFGVLVECAGPPAISIEGTCSGLVWNGDFETGDFFAWTSGGTMSYAGVNSAPQFVHSGNYGADLAGTFPFVSTLSQTLVTMPGAHYLLSFWLNNPFGNSPSQFLVSWDGHTVWGVTNFAAVGWTNVQVAVTAGATSTALQFTFEAPLYFGLDDVSVVLAAHPQPSIAGIAFSPTSSGVDLALNATSGQLGGTYFVLMSTNLALPVSQWTPMAVKCLDAGGNFTITATNAVDPSAPQRFYLLRLQ
ncbi:MAG: choice-of-anchor tandem repeat GloVer-containing protein [Verrucomicrobiota bacterium]|jgi:uncharacterized repeat protein (TIGR03803 family)